MPSLFDSFMTGYASVNPVAQDAMKFKQQQQDRQRGLDTLAKISADAKRIPPGVPLSTKMHLLADDILPVDPEASMKLASNAVKLQGEEFQQRKEQTAFQTSLAKEAGAMASGVQSQEQADSLFSWARENGAQLPEWLPRVYNAQTAPLYQRFGTMLESAADRQKVAVEAARIKHEQAMDDERARAEADRKLRDDRRDSLARDNLELRKKELEVHQDEEQRKVAKDAAAERSRVAKLSRPMNSVQRRQLRSSIIDDLSGRGLQGIEKGAGFFGADSKLDSSTLNRMTQDVYDIAAESQKTDPSLSEQDARNNAISWVGDHLTYDDKKRKYVYVSKSPGGGATVSKNTTATQPAAAGEILVIPPKR